MPVHARANFCGGGFGFVEEMHAAGTAARFFAPGVEWFGQCTEHDHTLACRSTFHKKHFNVPIQVGARALARAGNASLPAFVANTHALEDLAHLCRVARGAGTLVQDRIDGLLECLVSPRTMHLLCRHGGVSARHFACMTITDEGSAEDLYAVSVYRGWYVAKDRIPHDFDEGLFTSACLALHERLPAELRQLVLRRVFGYAGRRP